MRKRSSWAHRLKWGTGVLAVALIGIGGTPVSGHNVERAPSPPQGSPNSQPAQPGFAGYEGVASGDAVGAAAAPVEPDDPSSKPDDPTLGDPADVSGVQDVPGQDGSSDEADLETGIADPSEATGDSPETLAEALEASDDGTLRVIVTMDVPIEPEAELSATGVDRQRARIDRSLDRLDVVLADTASTVVSELDVIPAAALEVDQAGLDALLADPAVVSVSLDHEVQATLDFSTGVIDSDLLNAAGVLGNNFEGGPGGAYEVAILDSGVDNGHNAFAGRIVDQACFSAGSDCPNGLTSQIGAGAADDCTHSVDCDHGTHVAGIAAGSFYTGGHEGVARDARIVAINVASDSATSTRWTAFFSDINLGLQRVLNLRNGGRNIAAVNLSIGGGLFAADCGASIPATRDLVTNLNNAGVATIIAAGNDGSNTQVSAPGCLSNAFTISATDNADVPAGFTNSNALTDFWAPGVSITAPVPTTNNEGPKSGTSMSTPHVVGAFALLRECVDGNGVPQSSAAVAADLLATGVDVTRNGVTRRRINVLDAATRNVNNNDFAFPEPIPANPGAGFNDFDFNVCADAEAGEPGPFSLDNSIWWRWTPSATGTATISTQDNGSNVTTFDTTLAVYTGNTLPTLSLVASNDDAGGTLGLRSRVVFPVQAGTTYQIKVDGFAATNGLLNLHVENGPPPACFGVPATIVGTLNADVINGTAGADVIVAGDGNDTVNSLGGNDRICGGRGNDTINTGLGDDFVLGDQDSDVIRGEDGNDTLVGNPGGGSNDDANDTILGGPGNDFLDGWFGNDTLDGGAGNDQLRGEAGVDTASFPAAPGPVSASLLTNTATGDGSDTMVLVENLAGSAFNDVLVGEAGNNVLFGRNGHDRLDGEAGNDAMFGGLGNDLLIGRAGNDAYRGEDGIDTATFGASPAAVTASLAAGTANGEGVDSLLGVENMIGSAFNDDLAGDAGANSLQGVNGNDLLRGAEGNDSLDGGNGVDNVNGGLGNDLLAGRLGNDSYIGGGGVDTANYSTAPAAVAVNLTTGNAAGGEGADVLANVENVIGSGFNDNLIGNAVDNTIQGINGNDTIRGLDANDVLLGGNGNDLIAGGNGNDQLRGEAGDDRLFGEAGNDSLNGGLNVDQCNGGAGLDVGAACEAIALIP